ncbi:MAG: replication-associated recombination protein A [Chloroflexi bacterium]|nr:replication-associated recombination protein A [Chloroflexota bacterium]
MTEPLASSIRPQNLDEFIGQQHLVGPGKPLRVAIERGQLFSMIFWGPPGVGKTTLARIYANHMNANLYEVSAVSAGKADLRKIIDAAEQSDEITILFIDEIHRFNKAQQDFLLPYVENGTVTLIGATTENPSFEVISALLSRLRVFILHELSPEDMLAVIDRALDVLEADYPNISISEEALNWLISMANGDARQAITMLDDTMHLYGELTVQTLTDTLQSPHLRFDKAGEEHYNTISAFIKSMRASNVDAALYYLARMVEAGEDPKFIARRMVIFASEDIGIALPTALVVANAVFRAVETIGYPEAAINLAHGVTYLARAPKDRSSYQAYFRAVDDVKKHGNLPIPMNLRNAPTQLMKEVGYGKGYETYTDEDLLPDKLKGRKYYRPDEEE